MQIKEIKGFDSNYWVCDSGDPQYTVFSLKDSKPRWKVFRTNGRGYLHTDLYGGDNKKVVSKYIHTLLAEAFVPIPEKYQGISIDELEVHHIDFDRTNNKLSNLQWLTKEEHKKLHAESKVTKQRQSAAKKGVIPKANPPKQVAQFTKNGDLVASFASTCEAERQTGVNQGDISRCCKGKRNFAGGYVWKYL